MADHLQPAAGQAGVVVAGVEARRDLALDEVVQRGGLEVVAVVGVVDAVGGRDRPAVLAVVPLVPPAVEDRQVEAAVERGLHARRPAGLERAQRVVQPDVAARVEVLRHRDVVVGQVDDAVPDLGVVGEPHDLLDQRLALVVGRVRLAGDDQLDRSLGVQQQGLAAARGRAASASAACTSGRAARSRWSGRRGRARSRSSRARRRSRRGAARTRAAAGAPRAPAARASPGARPRPRRRGPAGRRPRRWRPRPGGCRGTSRPGRRPGGPPRSGACTPLVIEVIGTSRSSKPGQSPSNMCRLTSPCSCETPLARPPSRRPITAMLKTPDSPPG